MFMPPPSVNNHPNEIPHQANAIEADSFMVILMSTMTTSMEEMRLRIEGSEEQQQNNNKNWK